MPKEICPICEVGEAIKTTKREWFSWRGEAFLIDYACYVCAQCHSFYIDCNGVDPFTQVRDKYEEKHKTKEPV